jgi:DNA primase
MEYSDTKERIREATDIVDVISERIRLKKTGALYIACCPFHDEKTPSFKVNPKRQIYKCFGCGVGGDVFTFVMKHDGVDFREALRILGQRAGIPITFSREEIEREPMYDTLEHACRFFQRQFPGSPAASYIKARGFTDDTIDQFRLGYSPEGWQNLTDALSRKFNPELLEKAGLIRARESGGYYDFFRGRLMFPFFDNLNRIIGFGARSLEEHPEIKYLNSPETPLFSKGKLLYGLNFALRPIQDTKQIVVVEGYTDVNHSHQEGIDNVVAAIGTAFTDDHAALLSSRRFEDAELVFCFDGDDAGKRAALKTVNIMAGKRNTKVCFLPGGHDPDSFMKAGGDFKAELGKSQPAFDFFVEQVSEGINLVTAEGRLALLDKAREFIQHVPAERAGVYIETLSQKTGISSGSIIRNIRSDLEQSFERVCVEEDQRCVEAEFVRQLAANLSRETFSYFAGFVKPGDFIMPETRYTFSCLSDYLSGTGNLPLFSIDMSLLRHQNLDVIINEINKQANEHGEILNQSLLLSLFKVPALGRKPSLREIEYSYVMMLANPVSSQAGSAFWQRGKSLEDIVSVIREARKKLEDD